MSKDRFIEDSSDRVETAAPAGGRATLDFDQLKSGGIIKQRQKNLFTIRLQAPGGRLPIEKLKKVAVLAEKYAKTDYVHLSFRQSLEIPYVDYRDFAAMKGELDDAEQPIASCGARVRVPTACSGCEYNPNGLIDTQKLAGETHKKFFGEPTAHKFKMNFSGCPIDCARTSEADLGFQGAIFPAWEESACVGCTICERACREGAIVSDADGKPVFDAEKCLYCGDCVRNCPTEAWLMGKTGCIVRVGGKHGRHPLNASIVAEFHPEELVPDVIEKTIEWYRANSRPGERTRIGDILMEKGMDGYMEHMKDVFGAHAVENPHPPEPVEIHSKRRTER